MCVSEATSAVQYRFALMALFLSTPAYPSGWMHPSLLIVLWCELQLAVTGTAMHFPSHSYPAQR